MTPKDQLDAIFRAEVERMSTELEDIAFAARRYGRVDDVTEVEADIEVGWAYRLLRLYGTARALAFDEACPGRALLIRQGIPEAYIGRIAETFRSEQKGLRSQVFDKQIRGELERVGLADTIANRERAKVEFFKARADVLLDVGPRWPLVERASTALTRSVLSKEEREALLPIVEADDAEWPSQSDAAAAVGGQSALAPGGFEPKGSGFDLPKPEQPPATSPLIREPESCATAPDVPAGQVDATKSETQPDASTEQGPHQAQAESVRALPITRFAEEAEQLVKNKDKEWTPATANDARALIGIFRDILEEEGVSDTSQIRQHHIAALRAHFNMIPKGYGQSSRLRALKSSALRDYAQSMIEDGKLQPADVGLSSATIRKHLGNLTTFLDHVHERGYPIAPWSIKSLRPKKPKLGEVRRRQVKPGPEIVQSLFNLPIFAGCASEHQRDRGGKVVIHGALYYVPMLYAYLGARRLELAGLAVDDVVATQNGPALFLRDNDFRRLKNAQSERYLPIPDELIRLGFLDYTNSIRELGYKALFPELYSPDVLEPDPGDRFYKEFVPLLKDENAFGDQLWPRTIHALRHGFADTLYQAGVDSAVISDISGRLGAGETSTRYTNPAGLMRIKAAIAHYPVITGHLEPHSIRLLTHVVRHEPPPWAGRRRGDRFR